MEIWKSIPGYEDYEASNMGRVRRIGSSTCLTPNSNIKYKGYAVINLGSKRRKVQHCVLEAFVGPRPEGQVCRHLNGIKTDNRLENLKWGTQQENSDDAFEHGTGSHKLSKIHVEEIKKLYAEGMRRSVLAKRFGVSADTIKYHLLQAGLYKHMIKLKGTCTAEQVTEIVQKFQTGEFSGNALADMYAVPKSYIQKVLTTAGLMHNRKYLVLPVVEN